MEKISGLGVNAAGMKTLQKKFDGVEVSGKVEAKRQISQDLVSEIATEAAASVKRVDISSKLTSKLQKQLRNTQSATSWKTRVEGLEEMSKILREASYVA